MNRLPATISSLFFILISLIHSVAASEISSLRQRITGVDMRRSAVVDITLPRGFVLSGTVHGADELAIKVIARSEDGLYTSRFIPDDEPHQYEIVLPAGTYELTVKRVFDFRLGEKVVAVETDIIDTVTVSGDMQLDLTVPEFPERVQVSGQVLNSNNIDFTAPRIIFKSQDNQYISASTKVAYDKYDINLPRGTYNVIISGGLFSLGPSVHLSVFTFEIGTLVVNAELTFDVNVPPMFTLTGNVPITNPRPTIYSQVLAIDTTNPPLIPIAEDPCGYDTGPDAPGNFGASVFPSPQKSGDYRLILPAGSYVIGSGSPNLLPFEGPGLSRPFLYPITGIEISLTQDQTLDLPAHVLPDIFFIQGTVTDQSGAPVSGVYVRARSLSITNSPGIFFQTPLSSGRTTETGEYGLAVLSGTDYTIDACPRWSSSTSGLPD